jgi:hypothetical protein
MRKRILIAVALLFLGGATVAGLRFHKLAFIGAGYAAQQTCACLFISNRALDSCRRDLDPMARKLVTIEPGDNLVHAKAILSSATARFDPAFGCSLGD